MMKRLLALCLSLAVLVGMTGGRAAQIPFSDVPENSWYAEPVTAMARSGCVSGVSAERFDPYGSMTRAMVVTILYRMGGGTAARTPGGFSDVPNGLWFTAPVAWAAANGVTEGVGYGRFAPYASVTREQLVTLLCRYAGLRFEIDVNRASADDPFSADDPVSDWARPSMRFALDAGILRGRRTEEGVRLAAKETCTRAEATAMLYRLRQLALPEKSLPAPPAVGDDTLVYIRDYIPTIRVDLRYATSENFTGQPIYDFTEPQLRYGTVKKLAAAQRALSERGFGLLIWDGYRPVSAQFRLWEICPDSAYVANPNTGFSSHSRGNTVDLTLVTADGGSVEMPSGFDDFSARADRNYADVSLDAAANARLLEQVMTSVGFTGYTAEWWHYSDTVRYPVVF